MKSLLLLWSKLAFELANRCCTSATRDCETVTCRLEHEGLSFLTITLPDFGKGFEKSLDLGRVDPAMFLVSKRHNKYVGRPKFLGGFLDRVFDRNSGVLLDDPCIDSIQAIRQLTLMFSKVSLQCSNARVTTAMRNFIECEQEVRAHDETLCPIDLAAFKRVSSLLFGDIFRKVDTSILFQELIPRHGPGSTADKLIGNEKFNQSSWTARLEEMFPARGYLLPNWRFLSSLDECDFLEPGSEMPVRVITVPKTQKTPRVIAIEPTAMQYAQQAVSKAITEGIESSYTLNSILGFQYQEPNQLLAKDGSADRRSATLDLSDASDRVSNQLVREMVAQYPFLSRAIDASRSRKADVPGKGVIRLSKFASMGSALCFPIEAMVFTTIIFLGIEKELNTTLSWTDVKRLKRKVRVYGDDLIVPIEYVQSVLESLALFGAKVNSGKSYWNGKFRESCGKEYYDGHDVSIVKVRAMFPTDRTDATGVISMIAFRNQLYHAGCWQTCRWLDGRISKITKHYPVVLPTSPVQGRHSFLGFETQGYDESLHSPVVKGYVVSAKSPENSLNGQGALLKFFLKRGDLPVVDREHLERSGRPQRVDIMLRWASPF